MIALRVALVVTLLSPLLAEAQGTAARKIKIAVMEIRALATDAAKVELLSEVALTEAASIPGLDVIGRSDIASMIGFEKQKQVAGCSDDYSCLAEVGGALGVDFILVGSLGRIGTYFRLDLKVVEIKKSKVRGRIGVNVEGSEERLVIAVQKAVRDLLTPVATVPAPTLAVSPPATTAERSPAPGIGGASTAVAHSAPERGGTGRTRAYIAGGIGAAFLVAGTVAGLQARSSLDAEKKASASGDVKAYDDNKAKVRTMSLVADGLFLGGAAGLGIGTWFWFSGRPAPAVTFELAPMSGGAFASISGGF